MDTDARSVIESLPSLLDAVVGHLRITARFDEGQLCEPVSVTQFRLTPAQVNQIRPIESNQQFENALEHVSELTGLESGTLVAEFERHKGSGDASLRWVDISYSLSLRDVAAA